jgi:hypothetical protein
MSFGLSQVLFNMLTSVLMLAAGLTVRPQPTAPLVAAAMLNLQARLWFQHTQQVLPITQAVLQRC